GSIGIAAELCRVDQALVLPRPSVAYVDGGLLFAGQLPGEKVAVCPLQWSVCKGDILQRIQIVHGLGTNLRLLQVAGGVSILGIDEGARLRAVGVFKPTVVVNDLGAEIIVGNGDCL